MGVHQFATQPVYNAGQFESHAEEPTYDFRTHPPDATILTRLISRPHER